MAEMKTKNKIILSSLSLFADKGFEAVSVAEIAQSIGIKAPSLYKHFKSKQEIFNAIVEEMKARYKKQVFTLKMNGAGNSNSNALFMNIDEQEQIKIAKDLFAYFLHDEYVSKFRRMLSIEKFHNKELSALFVSQYIDSPLSYQSVTLGLLAQAGHLKKEKANIMALQFYSPIFMLVDLCDCNPSRETEAVQMIEEHIKQFNRLYRLQAVEV